MHDLNQIRKQNELAETQKSQARARAMNSSEAHVKKACKRVTLADRVAGVRPGACLGLDKLRK